MPYRISRNIEASIIDFIKAELIADSWTNVRTEKSFAEVYEGILPCICVNSIEMNPTKLEIGSKRNIKYFTINIRIFAKEDGSRLDLSDWLFTELEDDVNYYEYTIVNGITTAKILKGRITITRWLDNRKELVNTENLEKIDKFRHLLSFECFVAED